MKFTGERYLPTETGAIAVEHWHRYAAAATVCRGKRVLDVACGEGYGAALLARDAAEVVGIDTAAQVIEAAASTYGGPANLRFQQASLPQLGLPDASFDVIVSFETLEHVEDAAAAMAEFKRLLAPGGLLIASTPDRSVYSDKQGNRNPFHVHEMDHAEFDALCRSHFAHVGIVGQKVYLTSLMGPEHPGSGPELACFSLDDGTTRAGPPPVAAATYMVCYCSDAELPAQAGAASALMDNSASAHAERETLMDWAQSLKGERDNAAGQEAATAQERDALLEQVDGYRLNLDEATAKQMELNHTLGELRRRQGQAIEAIARDVADLRTKTEAAAPLQAMQEGMSGLATRLAAAAEERGEAERTFLADEVVAPLRAAQAGMAELAAQVAAISKQRALDLEIIRTAIDHDRKALETLKSLLVVTSVEAELRAVHNSTSWRLTAPLRSLSRFIGRHRAWRR